MKKMRIFIYVMCIISIVISLVMLYQFAVGNQSENYGYLGMILLNFALLIWVNYEVHCVER